jgi:hypothetical protein
VARRVWLAGFVVGAFVLGCTGGRSPFEPPSTNRQACEAYADHLNGLLPCVGLVYDSDNLCEGTDLVSADLTPTYDCLRANTRCEGDEAVLETENCPLPLVALEGPVAATEPPQEGTR